MTLVTENIFTEARLAVAVGGVSYESIGRSWARKILYNAEEHLKGREVANRSDFGYIFPWTEQEESERRTGK